MYKGVQSYWSKGSISAFHWSKVQTTPFISLTTAICRGEPLIPPPLFTSTFSFSSRIFTISSYSLKIAKLKGVWKSLSCKLGCKSFVHRIPMTTPIRSSFTAVWSKLHFQSSIELMLKESPEKWAIKALNWNSFEASNYLESSQSLIIVSYHSSLEILLVRIGGTQNQNQSRFR